MSGSNKKPLTDEPDVSSVRQLHIPTIVRPETLARTNVTSPNTRSTICAIVDSL